MDDNKKKVNELLDELKKQEEEKNKQLIMNMWVLLMSSLIFYLGIIVLAGYTLGETTLFEIIVGVSTVLFVVVAFYGLKLEIDAGYYECRNCHHRFTVKYMMALTVPHMFTMRYLKCPKCNEKSWAKKVMTRE